MAIQTINPATGQLLKNYTEMSNQEVDSLLEKSQHAHLTWRTTPLNDRSQKMHAAAALLKRNKDIYAKQITLEMGKPITQARAEIEKCAWVCDYYATHAEHMLAPRNVDSDLSKSYIAYQPLGIIFAIMPWNYPFWQVFRFVAPNLMAGNAGVLSHAPITTGCGLMIEALLKEAGFPEGLFRTVIVSNETAAHMIENLLVRGVTLTGSDQAGRIVGAEAASALKKVVLELGGSDPYLILPDADLDLAADACVQSRLNNTGQVCISAKRIIVTEPVREAFESRIMDRIKPFKMGDPLNEDTHFGPMARDDLRSEVHKQVQASVNQGATLLAGGVMPEGEGFFYPPTVLKNVKKGMPARDEEIFGPVISLIDAQDTEEAISIANDTRFGLAGAVFTKDIALGEDIALNRIHTGTCYVNGFVRSDPRLPFGGIKDSGYGRELATEGIHEFMNIKTIGIV